ncbi:hypothetical protein Dfri01_66770 [Dyadobacter frigoris]|uniref:TlpA family protein disulfide reductase n=1 Tax=Dyadobacter frigoris TaxID=2576211 RepID=UPI0024A42580|nr:TlpA disulfide reductase family protein [Dyadobacter frigoris]GLU57216.1 hypothetical protein Dfri01_66770 [Dyadobacter frigoris]
MKKIIITFFITFLGLGICLAQKEKSSTVSITVRFAESGPGDSLFLSFQPYFFSFDDYLEANYIKQLTDQNGECRFEIPVTQSKGRFLVCRYFDVDTVRQIVGKAKVLAPLTPDLFWERGDKLLIEAARYPKKSKQHFSINYDFQYKISGIGAEKNSIKVKVDSAYSYGNYISGRTFNPFDQDFNYKDAREDRIKSAETALEGYKTKLDSFYVGVIKADFVYQESTIRFSLMKRFFDQKIKDDPRQLAKFLSQYEKSLKQQFENAIDPNSFASVRYLYLEAKFDDYVKDGDSDPERVIHGFYKHYQGILKDRLITLALSETPSSNFNMLLDSALAVVRDTASRIQLEKLAVRRSGQDPYAFNLPDILGKYVKLDDFKGKVVFVDFWYTGCGGCAGYFKNVLSKAEEHFEGKDIVFVTISADSGKSLWLKSIKTGIYVSDKSVNLFTEGQGFKHPAIGHYKFTSYPSMLLIDRSGKIQEFNTEALTKRDPDHLIRVLQAALDK